MENIRAKTNELETKKTEKSKALKAYSLKW